MSTNKKTNKKNNAKTAKAAKPKAEKQAVKCVLCGAEVKGTGNNPVPLAESGVCCDECNAKVVEARMKLAAKADRLAKRREYAKAYYQANREKLVAASAKSHAKRNASLRNQSEVLARVYDVLCGVVSEHGAEFFDAFYKKGGEAMMNEIETALNGQEA